MKYDDAVLRFPAATILLNVLTDQEADAPTILAAYRQACRGDWLRLPTDGYIDHHLPLLLAESRASNELQRLLVGSPDWLARQYQRRDGYNSYLTGIQHAIECYRDPLDDEALCRVIELYAARHLVMSLAQTRSNQGLSALVVMGHVHEVMNEISLVSDHTRRFEALEAIDSLLPDEFKDDMDQMMLESVTALRDQQYTARYHIVRGRFREALHAIVDTDSANDAMMQTIALGLIEVRDFWNAHTAIRHIFDPAIRIEILTLLLPEFPDLIDTIQSALADARPGDMIPHYAYGHALSIIGLREEAYDVFRRRMGRTWFIRRLETNRVHQHLGTYLVRAGLEDWMEELLDEIGETRLRDRVKVGMAQEYIGRRDWENALYCLDSVQDDTHRYSGLCDLARFWIREGPPNRLMARQVLSRLEEVRRISFRSFGDKRLIVAELQAALGEYGPFRELITNTNPETLQQERLEALAFYQARNGHFQLARQSLDEAQSMALALHPGTQMAIANKLCDHDLPEQAYQLLQGVDFTAFSGLQSLFLSPTYVRALARTGRYDEVQSRIREVKRRQSSLRCDVIDIMIERGDFEVARSMAAEIDYEELAFEKMTEIAIAAEDETFLEQVPEQLAYRAPDLQAKLAYRLVDTGIETIDLILEVLGRIRFDNLPVDTREQILSLLLQHGEYDLVHHLLYDGNDADALVMVAYYAEHGDFNAAQHWLNKIEDDKQILEGIVVIGLAGQRDEALALLNDLAALTDYGHARQIVFNLAMAYAQLGARSECETTMHKMRFANRGTFYAALTRFYLEHDDLENALEAIQAVRTQNSHFLRENSMLNDLTSILRTFNLTGLALQKANNRDINQYVQYITKQLDVSLEAIRCAATILAWKSSQWDDLALKLTALQ